MGEIERAAKRLNMSKQTLRLFIQQGVFGVAVKGSGDKLIYKVNWKEVEAYADKKL